MANGLVRHGQPAVVPNAAAADQAVNQSQLDAGLSGRSLVGHTHPASAITSGQLSSARMPQVMSDIRSTNPATGTIAIDATLLGNNRDLTATGDITLSVPTGGVNGQVLQIAILASGAIRNVTFNASYRRLTGIAAGPTPIPSGGLCRISMRCSTLLGANIWVVEAFGITQ